MTIETNDSAQGGASGQQNPLPSPLPQGEGAGAAGAGASPAQSAIPAELQPVVDQVVAERLRRAREKWGAEQQAKAQADTDAAEAKRLAEEQKWQELARKHEAKAAELSARLEQMERDQLRRDVAQAAGIPQLWQRLQGETAEELAADAKALAAMMQPATGQRTASTTPTPQAQGGQADYVRQAIEKQQRRATGDDPYAAMMKR